MRNAIVAQTQTAGGQSALRALDGADRWEMNGATLQVRSSDPRVCAAVELDEVVVAFKGFLHGPGIAPELRHDARAAAEHLAHRWQRGANTTDDVWGRYQVYILDKSNGTLQVEVDPYGSAETYVRTLDGTCHVSSSLACLAECGTQGLELDRSLEDFLLVYGFIPRPQTPFVGVERLAASASVAFTDGERVDTKVSTAPAWDQIDWKDASEDDVIEALHDGFFRSIDDLAPDDDEVAVMLGGFDSALVAAGLAKRGRKVHTYTFRYSNARYNQPMIEEVAASTGATHHWYDIEPEAVADAFEQFQLDVNAPTNWPAYVVQTRLVADQIRRDGHSVCFSGDGCDNLFFGYPLTFRRGQVVEGLSRIPNPALAAAGHLVSSKPVSDLLGRPSVVASGVLANAQLDNPARGYLTFRIFDPATLTRLRNGKDPDGIKPDQLATELAQPFRGKDSVQLSYLGKKCLTPSAMKITSSLDSSGVSILSPYQHAGMVALAAATPTELLRPTSGGQSAIGKYALTTMAERYKLLPAEVVHQPKLAAADVPLAEWYGGPLRPALTGMLDKLPFDPDPALVESMFGESWGERAYMRLISRETSGIVNLHHDISLLGTYGAIASLASAGPT